MSITRIGEMQAKPETTKALGDFLLSIIPTIKSSPGCESVALYQSHDDPTKFIVIEVWDSIESHQASVRNIPSEMLAHSDRATASVRSNRRLLQLGSSEMRPAYHFNDNRLAL